MYLSYQHEAVARHVSAHAGFADWNGGSIGWDTFNSTAASISVRAGVGDNAQALLASSSIQKLALSDANIATMGTGRFLQLRFNSRA